MLPMPHTEHAQVELMYDSVLIAVPSATHACAGSLNLGLLHPLV